MINKKVNQNQVLYYMNNIKKIIVCVMAALVLLLSGCGVSDADNASDKATENINKSTAQKSSKAKRHKVIIDTDTGSDDAAALTLAASSEQLDILGVTVLYGNVSLKGAADNALMTLEVCDVEAPVYIGAEKTAYQKNVKR